MSCTAHCLPPETPWRFAAVGACAAAPLALLTPQRAGSMQRCPRTHTAFQRRHADQ
ncbi:hypothetical protein XMIN_1915 [Xanthomonas citri pv. mangiferaeindicae LMG 941]|nr:hypothetical protein XAPC_2142 [Xanthomonas citri pv. punicae str. LMG 859]CCG36938.1 hypothetical protein XMIN_1915 [Xanthomonas citri pv. mangiferaeindicae LMG 941]